MTTYDKLDTINDSLVDIKDAIIAKGVTPSGNITTYATAIGQISGGGGNTRFGLSLDNFIGSETSGVLGAATSINGITFTDVTEIGVIALRNFQYNTGRVSGRVSFPDLTTIDDNGLENAFPYNQITSVDLSSLTTVGDNGMANAFSNNQITSVGLPSLATVGEYGLQEAFSNNQITSVGLPSLATVGIGGMANAFASNSLASVDLSSLTTVGNYGLDNAFQGNNISSVNFTSLSSIGMYGLSWTFIENSSLQSVSFPALTSQSFEPYDETAFNDMLQDLFSVTVHFPSNLQAVIGNWQSVIDGFSGVNTTVLFDLPSTENS